MPGAAELEKILRRIDGRGYKAYREIRGRFDLGPLAIFVDHVQGDPFAAPSRLRLRLAQGAAALPHPLFANPVRHLALRDHLARRVRSSIAAVDPPRRGSGRSGAVSIDAGGQEVLDRTSIRLTDDWVEARIDVGLPAAGRRVLGDAARALLCQDLPEIARRGLAWSAAAAAEAQRFVETVENQEHLRALLSQRGLLAFVADGAVLPRASGADDRPLRGAEAVPFRSPDSLRVRLPLRNAVPGSDGEQHEVSGLGVREGVTLVVGGGYHGKSTLLRALERAVYPHVPGDGREWVVSRSDLVKIRAEDGRRVEGVDIEGFIRDLPGGRATRAFRSDDASGSTSQAANIAEAIEAGSRGLLLDEDTSATNFLVRDARMQALVGREAEPITPLVDRVRALHRDLGVSTVLVMGGSGDYFDVADCVIQMRDFAASDATARAREIAASRPTGRVDETGPERVRAVARIPDPHSLGASRGDRRVAIDAREARAIRYGTREIDLRAVDQLVDPSQARAVGFALHLAARRFADGAASLAEILDRIEAAFDREGLDVLDPRHGKGEHPGRFARPRRYEIAAAINRLRSLAVEQRRSD